MKKIILTCLWVLPACLFAQSSSKKVSFYAQGGYRSTSYIREAAQKRIMTSSETHHHRCIILNAGLQLELPGNWRAGFTFTYDHFGTKQRSREFSNISYMIRADHTWKKWKGGSVYSGAAAGVRNVRELEEEKERSRTVRFASQLYLAGIRYEPVNRLFIDANAGWGVSGFINLGCGIRF